MNTGHPQGFGPDTTERIGLPPREAMSEAQRAAADAIINGPRKAVFGPFVPLLQTPALMERVGKLGEALRFEGSLPERLRELVICAVARHCGNQFEWQLHAANALKAGVAEATLAALLDGRVPRGARPDESAVLDFSHELMHHHGVCDATFAHTEQLLGQAGVVELSTLVGYFAMVCWVMNVARTPGPAGSQAAPLAAWPG